jgi:recombination protein RecA
VIGNRVKVKVVKNKVAAPFRTTEFDIMYNEGISVSGDILDTGVQFGVIEKSGNTHSFHDTKLGVGREAAKSFLRENPKVMAEIRAEVIRKQEEEKPNLPMPSPDEAEEAPEAK